MELDNASCKMLSATTVATIRVKPAKPFEEVVTLAPARAVKTPRRQMQVAVLNETPPPRYSETMDEAVVLNVGGRRFETMMSTLQNIPNTRLADLDKLSLYWRPDKDEFFFDRHSQIFEAVLNYYRSGELHIPLGLCGPIVKRELDFWGIVDEDIEMCCLLAYASYQSQKESLLKFDQERRIEEDKVHDPKNCWQRTRPTVWKFLNNPRSSKGAMAYAVISTIMIIISIIALVLASHSTFRIDMSDEDWAVYHKVSLTDFLSDKHGRKDRLQPLASESSGASSGDSTKSSSAAETQSSSTSGPPVAATNTTLRGRGKRGAGPGSSAKVDSNSTGSSNENMNNNDMAGKQQITNILSALLENQETTEQQYDTTEDISIPHPCFFYINVVCIAFFTLEYIVRFIFAPKKLRFLIAPLNIIDVLSVLPFFIMEIILLINPQEKYLDSSLDIVTALQVIRVFRVFRMMQHFNGMMVLMYTLKVSCKEILLTFVFVCMGILIFGCLMYYVDSKATYTSIPQSFWWAIVTMTTVGYGDMYPSTEAGYVVGSLCAMSGVLVIALTVPIVVNNFMLFYQHAASSPNINRNEEKKGKAMKNKVENDMYLVVGQQDGVNEKLDLSCSLKNVNRCESSASTI